MIREGIPDDMPEPLRSKLVETEAKLWGMVVGSVQVKRAIDDIPRTGAGGVDHRKMLSALRTLDDAVEGLDNSTEDAYHKLHRMVNGWRSRRAAA